MQEPVGAPSDGAAAQSILVVEHEAHIARDLQSSLIRLGYDVPITAASASEALDAMEVYHPDLVLMNVDLEESEDGIVAAAAIRARHPTPIVFLAAPSDNATLIRAQENAQPHGYLLKPYQDGELRAAVEVALRRHKLEQDMLQQRSLLEGVLGGMSDAVAAADVDGKIVLFNEAGRRVFGQAAAGSSAWSANHYVYRSDRETPCPAEEMPLARALSGETVRDMELFIRSPEDTEGRFYSVNAAPLLDGDGLIRGAVEVGRDVTDFRAARSELQQQSETDALTGAYNRRGFMQIARTAFEIAQQSGRQPAVFFIDLNGMKRINDSLGHPEGDRLLMDVTWIIRACLRTSDIVGRLGGDEFVVLAPDAGGHADVLRERLRAAVDEFNDNSERAYRISISIGMSISDPDCAASLEDLVEQADKRMYEDKELRAARRAGSVEPPRETRSARPSRFTSPPPASRFTSPSISSRFSSAPPSRFSSAPPSRFSSAPPSRFTSPHPAAASLAAIPPPSRRVSSAPRAITPVPRLGAKRILLVDDEPRNLALLERLLLPLGHQLIRAEDGPSAITAFAACKPDLVLLDLVMPGMDGLEVLSYIRSNLGDDHVPVIVLTAHSEREHKLRGLEAGADDFLEKPADGRSLRVRVTTLLQLKDSRDALRQVNEKLESRNAELAHLQREQRELTAFIVHDLKNPLAVAWAGLEYARDGLGDDRPDMAEVLGEAAIACGRLRSMIDDLIVISRLEDSGLPLHNQLVELWDLLREVFGEYALRAAHKHVTLLAPERTQALVVADRALLRRVIENILDNALRYTPHHGRMGITARTGGEIEITLSNTGPSIPPSDRERIFEKFARLERNGVNGNAGLGLYFCKRVVEGLGGRIEITETPEWPTSFVLRLPAAS